MWYKRIFSPVDWSINQVSKIAGVLAVIFLMIIMLVTFSDVIMRYFFNSPIYGAIEIVDYSMIATGFLGFAWCASNDGHLRVGMLVDRFSTRVQAIIDSCTYILGMIVVTLVAWRNIVHARYVSIEQNSSPLLHIPEYPFYLVIGVSFTLLLLVMITLLVKSIRKMVAK